MQVKKQDINVGKAVFEGEIKSGAEGSLIVPDVKPDILKVLQVDAETFLNEKTIDNGKLILKGKVLVNVLYVPESEGDRVQCIKGCFEFCETVKRAEFEQGMDIIASCDARKVGYKLINSRKIGIEAYVNISVCVTERKCISYICRVDEESCQVKTDHFCIKEVGENKEFTFKIDETVDMPCRNAAEILKSNVTITEKDYRIITGKIVLKGKVCASILYVTEAGNYEHLDFEMPFTEVFDFDGIEEECECEVTYQVLETEFALVDCVNENGKSVSADINVNVFVHTENCTSAEYIKDCYFTDAECSQKYTEIECEEVLEKPMFSTVLKQVMEKDKNLPEISVIYASVAKPYITSTDVHNNRIAVSGKVTVYVLYMSDDAQSPISSLTDEVSFSYMIDCTQASRETDVLLSIECEHISCILNGANSVEIRCGLGIKGKVVKRSKIDVISEISVSETDKKDNAMIVYFVKEDDTLWKIGKHYHVKCQDICDCNSIKDDDVICGQKLVIPISK